MTPEPQWNIHRTTNRGWAYEPERKVAGPMSLDRAKREVYRLHDQANDAHGIPRGEDGPYHFHAVPAK